MPQFIAPQQCPGLQIIVDSIPASLERIAQHLGTTTRTLSRWIAEESAPRAMIVALYMESHYGRQAIDCDLYNRAELMTGLADCLRRDNANLKARIERLESLGQFGSANEPYMTRAL